MRSIMGRRLLLCGAAAALAVACRPADDPAATHPSTGGGSAGGGGQGGSAGGGAAGAGGGAPVEDTPASTAPRGAEATAELCANGQDDDGNGYTDCEDSWCRQTMELSVCDSLENTVEKCSDGADNVESPRVPSQTSQDGRIDCADPDCAKSPALSLCGPRTYELGASCDNGVDDDADGLADCDDLDCLHAGASACPLGGRRRVLFDDAHRQRAGNGDWVADMPGRHPWPTVPAGESDWAGLLSALGADLLASDFVVETLPAATGRMTFESAGEPQDLSQYAVVLVPEPSAPFDPDESAALLAFVLAGGGLLMVTDHYQSDRDGNGWDSTQVWNDFFERSGGGQPENGPFGFSVAPITYDESGAIEAMNGGATTEVGDASHPVLAGPHGAVTRIGMHRGGLFTIYAGQNPTVTVLFHALPIGTVGYQTGSPYVVAAEVGAGRVIAIGDSAILGDGTNSHGLDNPGFDAYHEAGRQNGALLRNAVEWLAGP